jgi:hypothetical protein
MPAKDGATKKEKRAARAAKRALRAAQKAGLDPEAAAAAAAAASAKQLARREDLSTCVSTGTATVESSERRVGFTFEPSAEHPKEFDSQEGTYTVSVDGIYLVNVRVVMGHVSSGGEEKLNDVQPGGEQKCAGQIETGVLRRHTAEDKLSVLLVISDSCSGIDTFHEVSATCGTSGRLVHLSRGDKVSVQASPAVVTDSKGSGAAIRVSISIELAMRKSASRKRKRDAAGLDLIESEGCELTRKQRRKIEKRRAEAAAAAAAAGMSSGTGSDTEWEDGFSSDDDSKVAKRREARRLKRGMRTLGV